MPARTAAYWSSTQYMSDGYDINYLDFHPGAVFINSYGIGCYYGLSIRPVVSPTAVHASALAFIETSGGKV